MPNYIIEEDGQMSLEILEQHNNFITALKVRKSNELIQNARFSFSKEEAKIINFVLTKIKIDDDPNTVYTFSAKEFLRLQKRKGKYNYESVFNKVKNIADKSFVIKNDDGNGNITHTLVRWFNITRGKTREDRKNAWEMELSIHPDLHPYVTDLIKRKELAEKNNEKFFISSFSFATTEAMKTKYAPRLFEILISYSNKEKWYFEIEEIIEMLSDIDPQGKPIIKSNWRSPVNFEERVIKPAVEEINKFSDEIHVDYQYTTTDLRGINHKKVCGIWFYITEKTVLEKSEARENIIEEIGDVAYYREINEEVVKEHTLKMERENAQSESDMYEVINKAGLSDYDYNKDFLTRLGFNEEEAVAIWNIADMMRPINVNPNTNDYWTRTYIEKTFFIIKGDGEKDVTKFYVRMIDAITYDKYGIKKHIENSIRNI